MFLHHHGDHNRIGLLAMIDRTTIYGMGGTLATISGKLHEFIGILAGMFTICFLAIKIYQAIRDDNK